MKEKIKTLLSYFYPVKIETRSGDVTPYLEVIRDRGKNVLNTYNANYSYDGLHIIMSHFFKHIQLQNYKFNNVLILGMGAGSVISLLRQNYNINCKITAVVIDAVVIDLAKRYFNIELFNNLTIIHQDAFDFASNSTEKYDLIISDLFIDSDVPKKFASVEYLINLKKLSSESCLVAYNKMTDEKKHKDELTELLHNFESVFPGCELVKLYAYNSENSMLFNNTHTLKNTSETEVGKLINKYKIEK
jgi:spermidine synthase